MSATPIKHLHHVTATVSDAQEDVDFYVSLLGLRLVKKTVNFDNPGVYHFYYGNTNGTPGTIMTTFPYKGQGVRVGRHGSGQITVTSFSVPPGALGFWRERLAAAGVAVRDEGVRMGEPVIAFDDPSGLVIELIGCEDIRPPWTGDGIAEAHAIRGFHSVTLSLQDVAPTLALMQNHLGFRVLNQEGARTRVGVGEGSAAQVVDLLHTPDLPRGLNGLGAVHHVAFAIPSDEEQQALRERLLAAGYGVTDVRDRQYFHSIYFREPGGVLFEVATIPPGFEIDEDPATLGTGLRLPPWEEYRRHAIEQILPPVTHPAGEAV